MEIPMVTLYLESWQKRMLKDFSKLKRVDQITTLWIKLRKGGCPASYKIPVGGIRKDDWLIYLTDAQILQVKEQFKLRTPVTSVNITREAMEGGEVGFK